MPNIKPISDLRNYTEVLKEVKINAIISNNIYNKLVTFALSLRKGYFYLLSNPEITPLPLPSSSHLHLLIFF